MAELKTYTCDLCGEIKKESNNWLQAIESDECIVFVEWNANTSAMGFGLHKEIRTALDAKLIKDICGERCAVRLLSDFLGRRQKAGAVTSDFPLPSRV